MKHLHNKSGLYFECGELIDRVANETYDITVITLWHDPNEDVVLPPELVNFYFGEYDPEHTDYYIDRWFEERAAHNEFLKLVRDCKGIVDAYWLTNEDVLVDNEYDDTRSKVQRVRDELKKLLEVITNASMPC